MSQREKLIWRLAKLLPRKLAAEPERVLINFICACVGVAVLISSAPTPLWPPEVAGAWAVAMVAGGLCALVGFWNTPARRWAASLERVGYLALLLAALPYGVRLITVYGWRGVPVGGVFLAIAAAKAIRLLISSAARDQVLRSGRESGDDR